MAILKYLDLYQLVEELQQLQGAQFQALYNPSPLRYVFEMRLTGESRLLVLDLTPTGPFIVSTSFTKTKTPGKKTPVFNFLKAHFVNHSVQCFEIAQKPNRTLKIIFSRDEKEIIFKCFPHGQHLILKSGEKGVSFPWRPRDPADDSLAFVEPEVLRSWDFNNDMATHVLGEQKKTVEISPESHSLKLINKLERASEALRKGIEEERPKNAEKIKSLEAEGARLSLEKKSGAKIQEVFNEIKRIQKKERMALERQNDFLTQIEKLKREGVAPSPVLKAQSFKKNQGFSGTRVRISTQWELWVGRTDWQNDDLLREASSHDLWIHLRDYPGAHGVLRGPKKSEPTGAQVEHAARIVAILSQTKKSPFSEGEKLDFIVTPKKFVKKRKGALPGRVNVERETVRRFAFKTIKFEVIH